MRHIFYLLAASILCIDAASAHEVLLAPSCRQQQCGFAKMQNIVPVAFLPNGIVKQFEVSYFSLRCSNADDEEACIREANPSFTKYEKAFAFCSTTSPAVLSEITGTNDGLGKYSANYFDFTEPLSSSQTPASIQYLIACHGGPADNHVNYDTMRAFLKASGYRKPEVNSDAQWDHARFQSAEEFIKSLNEHKSERNRPFYIGRWYSNNVRVCKGRSGETEGLLTYTDKQFIGYENTCDIVSVAPAANRIDMKLRCQGEGMSSTERELVQTVRGGNLLRTTFEATKSYQFEYKRCP